MIAGQDVLPISETKDPEDRLSYSKRWATFHKLLKERLMCWSSWAVYPLGSDDLFSGIYLQFLWRGSMLPLHLFGALGKAWSKGQVIQPRKAHDLLTVHQHISPREKTYQTIFYRERGGEENSCISYAYPVVLSCGLFAWSFSPQQRLWLPAMLEKQLSIMMMMKHEQIDTTELPESFQYIDII